ncbi:GNAT family N-acetyltransferase [Arundinibacter roseus]|uniref:GNAT family N-acetyltransferase n=1 Tax=Arundinibacter roseus TaxID=2070510 RepID=A0A4V2X9X4_9BACT|nr:GNAT family N-acetyltransferase [Arundinibacter roseus]TDB65155.1 GNAT family N-acetyltransferase [Arundinibacter roseus]
MSYKNSENGLKIRLARASDRDELYQMLCDLENEQLNKKSFTSVFEKNLTQPQIRYFIAEQAGRIVGMASCHVQLLLHHAGPVGEIQEMYVQPSVRSQGIGRALIHEIQKFVLSHNGIQLEVTTNRLRLETHRFYEREGFLKSHFKLVLSFSDHEN